MGPLARRLAAVGGVCGGLALVAGAGWAAWAARRPLRAPPIRITQAYVDGADTVGPHRPFAVVLARAGIVGRERTAFFAAATALPLRRLPAGLIVRLRRLRTDSTATRVSVRLTPELRVRLDRTDAGWVQSADTIPWTATPLRVSGVIETSLYDALDRAVPDTVLPAGERRALAWALADVYDWEIDFTRDVRPGDHFRVLVERRQSAEGETRLGRILAARVDVGRVPNFAYRFAADSGSGAFFDPDGRSLKRTFLRAPLQFRRISSGFGDRFHPILHIWRHHDGVDFSAPYGTPVRATADGVVVQIGWEADGYGNFVELRHPNGIRTLYGHLEGFAHGLQVGARVTQGTTIGFVGSTGLSTGPHLHYEFRVNGRPTNPLRHDLGPGTPVPVAVRARYDSVRTELEAALEGSLAAASAPPPGVPARVD